MNSTRTLSSSPRGSITLLPGLSEQRRWLAERCLDVMKRWGYAEVVTPIFEFLDVISRGVSDDLMEQGYKLTDRQSGRVMIIRPDVTPQIARIATTSYRDIRPLRLSYALDVFRYEQSHGGRQRELFQIGAELIGVKTPEGDLEIMGVLRDILEELGISEYRVIISHSDYLRGILKECPEDIGEPLMEIIRKKSLSGLGELLKGRAISKRLYERLSRLLFLFGERGILTEARRIGSEPLSVRAVEVLERFYEGLKEQDLSDRVLFDLSEAEGLQYHSGIVFHVIDFRSDLSLGYGGRYDEMLAHFGQPDTGTGFSLDAQALLQASTLKFNEKEKILLCAVTGPEGLSERLRKMGYSVVQSYEAGKSAILREARNIKADFVIKVNHRSGDYELISLKEGLRKKTASEGEILKYFEEVN